MKKSITIIISIAIITVIIGIKIQLFDAKNGYDVHTTKIYKHKR